MLTRDDPGPSGSPNLLPADLPEFTDRQDELQSVARILRAARSEERQARIWLTGAQGVGKTTLAVHLAYRYLAHFPAAQFYQELGGSTPGDPADPAEVSAHFLRQLNRPADAIPARSDERQQLLRSLMYGKRFLLVLDDIHNAAQVETLMPSSPHAVIVVTSRRRHERMYAMGFAEIEVGRFTDEISAQLLTRSIGADLVTTEPDAVRTVISVCDGLPLALSVATAKLAKRRHNHRSLAAFVDTLRTNPTLDQFRLDGAGSIGAVWDACYRDLLAEQADAYRLLALHPGPDFGIGVAAVMLGVGESQAGELLDGLADDHLLQPVGGDRYRFHNLIGRHARDLAFEELDEARRRAAVEAAVRWYLHRLVALMKGWSRTWWTGEAFDGVPVAYTGPDARKRISAELETEQHNLKEAVRAAEDLGLNTVCAQLCQALRPWYYDTDRNADLVAVMEIGVQAAERTGRLELVGRMYKDVGSAYEKLGELPEAGAAYRKAERIADRRADFLAKASAIEGQGLVYEQAGDLAAALERLHAAREIVDTVVPASDHRERAQILLHLHTGRVLDTAGRADEAIDGVARARRYFTDHDEPVNAARAAQTLGNAHASLGKLPEARALLQEASGGFERDRSLPEQRVKTLLALADVLRRLDEPSTAHTSLDQARELAAEAGLVALAEEAAKRLGQPG